MNVFFPAHWFRAYRSFLLVGSERGDAFFLLPNLPWLMDLQVDQQQPYSSKSPAAVPLS